MRRPGPRGSPALAALVAAVFAVVVLGIGRVPDVGRAHAARLLDARGRDRRAAVRAGPSPARRARRVAVRRGSPDEVLRSFGHRITRPLPLDELLLQLAESLRDTLALDAAEVWTGSGGVLERVASDPDAGGASLILDARRAGRGGRRAGVRGEAWLRLWLPQLLEGREDARCGPPRSRARASCWGCSSSRAAPVERRTASRCWRRSRARSGSRSTTSASARRSRRRTTSCGGRPTSCARRARASSPPPTRSGGASSATSTTAPSSTSSRWRVNLRLARELADSDPAQARAVLEELAGDVQDALQEFRDLAHGIYPPLLVERGLGEGLRSAAARAPGAARGSSSSGSAATRPRSRRRSTSAAWRRCRTPASTPAPARARPSACGRTGTGCCSRSPTTAPASTSATSRGAAGLDEHERPARRARRPPLARVVRPVGPASRARSRFSRSPRPGTGARP